MNFFFANPWGWLALLGVPAVILIHLLRRKSRQVRVSTLFLVERVLPSSEGGRRFRMLRNSLPLWVQILAVVALAWLLARPRWIDATSTQTVVAVFDSSASASAFRKEILQEARRDLSRLAASAATTRWIFLRSDGSRIATGSSLESVLAETATGWQPTLGTHDISEAFRLARTLAGKKGHVVYFTDHLPLPNEASDVDWVAAGEPFDNTGFLGAEARGDGWTALLKNFGTKNREVSWRAGENDPWKIASLAAGATREISGGWPAGTSGIVLETSGDRFTMDDRLPLMRPQEKRLNVKAESSEKHRSLFEQLVRIAEPVTAKGTADVTLAVYDPIISTMPAHAAMVFVSDSAKGQKTLTDAIVPENHPLMEDLNWQGLVARDTLGVPFRDDDTALLWQGKRPLIFLRSTGAGSQLVFNFDVLQSNAARLPAFALLAHRFFSSLRQEKIAAEAANFDTGQEIHVAGVGKVFAPAVPDFFTAKSADGAVLLEGASQFADSRESDYQAAASGHPNAKAAEAAREANEIGEFLNPLWALVLAGLMLWNWVLTGAPPRAQTAA